MKDLDSLLGSISCKATNAKAVLDVVIDSFSAVAATTPDTRREVSALYGLLDLLADLEVQAESAEAAWAQRTEAA